MQGARYTLGLDHRYDNTPSLTLDTTDIYENIKLVFLPPNTITLLQLMDQYVIKAIKEQYWEKPLSDLVSQISAMVDTGTEITVKECSQLF